MRSPLPDFIPAEDPGQIDDPADYILILRFEKDTRMPVGALGEIDLERGYYAYIGSAKAGLRGRAGRHLSNPVKRRWHIDHITGASSQRMVFWKPHEEGGECKASGRLREFFKDVKGFGSSDCRCPSHLFYLGPEPTW
ncbi:MAG: GIY-YIG nuclease family protein [Thermoplasmatota archaeon]